LNFFVNPPIKTFPFLLIFIDFPTSPSLEEIIAKDGLTRANVSTEITKTSFNP